MVDILLATYNGANYLAEQLDSIIAQTYDNWHLYVRDDGSSDDTPILLQNYQQQYPHKISIINDGLGNIGVIRNFSLLMQTSNSDYIMFCDQDDVWKSEKIALTLELMQKTEGNNINLPVLVHTDLHVTNEYMQVIAESFWGYQNINPQRDKLQHLLVHNVVTGCTCMINRRLLQLAGEIPKQVKMHDWWLALVASMLGKIAYSPIQTMYYRQHGKNDTGAYNWSLAYILKRIIHVLKTTDILEALQEYITQAKILKVKYERTNSIHNTKILDDFVAIESVSRWNKVVIIVINGFFKQGFSRNVAMVYTILTARW